MSNLHAADITRCMFHAITRACRRLTVLHRPWTLSQIKCGCRRAYPWSEISSELLTNCCFWILMKGASAFIPYITWSVMNLAITNSSDQRVIPWNIQSASLIFHSIEKVTLTQRKSIFNTLISISYIITPVSSLYYTLNSSIHLHKSRGRS